MPKIDRASAPVRSGSRYPSPFDECVKSRSWSPVGDHAGLSQFGANLVTIPPGGWSSQRHWHTHEDELVMMIEGELVLVTDAGEQAMRPGDIAAFKAGVEDGHHLINKSGAPATFLVVGGRDERDACHYPDIDMHAPGGEQPAPFTRKDGTPF
ncbi:cupin domain-containing protein [bacterium]|nr:cupin domain-containing protein [bacterium]